MAYQAALLIAFGGPERFEDVRPFLANVLKGRKVPQERIEKVVEQYRVIGGKSPMNEITSHQAQALVSSLYIKKSPLKVYVGMRNWQPYIHDTLAKMKEDGITRAIGIVLAAYRSEASWEKYLAAVEDAQKKLGPGAPKIDFCDNWNTHPLFIDAIAERVKESLSAAGKNVRDEELHWIFTAHSIPMSMDRESGYSQQFQATAELVTQKLVKKNWHIAYQSRSGMPEDPWLEPDVTGKMRELHRQGVRSVLIVPAGFVADHVEVLYDLDMYARGAANAIGLEFHRAKTVNDHPRFIEMLSELILTRMTLQKRLNLS